MEANAMMMVVEGGSTGGVEDGGMLDRASLSSSRQEEYDEKELRQIVAELAPSVLLSEEALENMLASEKVTGGGGSNTHATNDPEDDGMGEEEFKLEAASDFLSRELRMLDIGLPGDWTAFRVNSFSQPPSRRPSETHLAAESVGDRDDDDDVVGEGNDVAVVSSPSSEAKESTATTTCDVSLPRLMDDSAAEEEEEEAQREEEEREKRKKKMGPYEYTLLEHAALRKIRRDASDLGLVTCPVFSLADTESMLELALSSSLQPPVEHAEQGEPMAAPVEKKEEEDAPARQRLVNAWMECGREYLEPPTTSMLRKLYVGVALPECATENNPLTAQPHRRIPRHVQEEEERRQKEQSSSASPSLQQPQYTESDTVEPLPIRTAFLRIRPDVLVGAVMDAVSASIQTLGGEITKRQGGHLAAILPGCIMEHPSTPSPPRSRRSGGRRRGGGDSVTKLPPFVLDIQLVTKKRDKECQRILLVRAYRVTVFASLHRADAAAMTDVPPPTTKNVAEVVSSSFGWDQDDDKDSGLIREAAAVVQRMEWEGRDVPTQDGNALTRDTNAAAQEPFSASVPLLRTTVEPQNRESDTATGRTTQDEEDVASPRAAGGGGMTSRWTQLFSLGILSPSDHYDDQGKALKSTIYTDEGSAAAAVSSFVQDHWQATPSVRDIAEVDQTTFPALSKDDWPYVQSSWRFLRECWNELDNRNLSYSTLASAPFGLFPSLSTLDVHFCSQIRLLCRENMIISLLKTASDLEYFAREAEYSCANMIQLLRPMFKKYGIQPPALPQPVPLTAYPLDFHAPEALYPPWGQHVMRALDIISNDSSSRSEPATAHSLTELENKKDTKEATTTTTTNRPKAAWMEFRRAAKAVSLVVQAFQKQDDVEQGARLGRKNVQVMDRLAKMQAHKRASVIAISDSYRVNDTATREANKFHAEAKICLGRQETRPAPGEQQQQYEDKDEHDGSEGEEEGDESPGETATGRRISGLRAASDQVPLLECSVLVGGSTGCCFVTAHEMMLSRQVIPMVGSHRHHVLRLSEMELVVLEPSSSLLNPLRAAISVRPVGKEEDATEEILQFIPYWGAHRFKLFVDVVRTVATEDPESLKFSARGGLLYMFDESREERGKDGGGGGKSEVVESMA